MRSMPSVSATRFPAVPASLVQNPKHFSFIWLPLDTLMGLLLLKGSFSCFCFLWGVWLWVSVKQLHSEQLA